MTATECLSDLVVGIYKIRCQMRKRKFIEEEVNHIYQRTESGFNIFYEVEDYLVYYTIFSIASIRYHVTVYGLCLMIDHIHSLCAFKDKMSFSRFMSFVSNVFVKEYNNEHCRKGALFSESFGSAPKTGIKLLRTAVAYLYNNAVERHLCKYAQDFRWNFLSFAQSSCPFSYPLILRKASYALQRAVAEVNGSRERSAHLTYPQLKRLFSGLDEREKNQLIDYIIMKYSVIRFDILTTLCYDGYENMITAINSNAGSEYEIYELRWGRSDTGYRELYKFVRSHGFSSAGGVISLDIDAKFSLHDAMHAATNVSSYQICKFLHLRTLKSQ